LTAAFLVAGILATSLALPAQGGPTTPSGGNRPRTTSGAAGDDGPCSSAQAGVGAEQFVMFDLPAYVNDAMLVHDPDNVRDPRTLAEPTFPAAPGSTVRMDGSLVYRFRMPEPPGLGSTRLGIGLTYRTWTDDPHNAGTATTGFDDSLHLTMVDRIETTEEDVLVWISGQGDAVELVEGVSPVPTPEIGETWYDANGGRALSRFRRYTDGTSNDVIERYRPDGAVMRYETDPGESGAWRPAKFFDSYDNAWVYHWRASPDHRLDKIVDPRGIETRFGWTSTTNPTTCNVTYVKGTTTFTDWSWSLTLDAGGRLATLTGPQTTWYDDAVTGPLLDLSSPQTDARTLTFAYHGVTGGPQDGWLDTITDSRLASGGAGYVVRSHTYATALGQPRVATQTDEQGLIHSFTWVDDSTHVELRYRAAEAGVAADHPTTMRFRMPSSVRTSWTTPWLPVEIEVEPGEFGDPREDLGEAPADQEPSSLTWQLSYGNCACGLIQQVTYPSGVVYAMTYDGMGNMTSWTGPDPSDTSGGAPATVTYRWSHHGLDRGGRPEWYHPPGYTTTLSTEVTFDYGASWVGRSAGLFGEKPTSLSVETGDVHGSSSGTQRLEISAQFDSATGRTTSVTDVGDVQFDYLYGGTGTPGEGLLTGIDRQVPASMSGDAVNRVRVTVDDLGRVTKVSRGTAAHETVIDILNDGLGRTVSATAQVNASGTPSVTEYYRDRFENVAVIRRKNLDETGNKPDPSARTWLRDEWHYHYGRLLESFMDRAPLDLAEDLVDPLGSGLSAGQRHLAWTARYQFAYRADGQLRSVTLPSGSVNRYEIDGYGTLFRIVADEGGLSVDLGRSYFDDDLVLRKRRKMLEDDQTWAVWTYARLTNGSAIQSVTDPTGLVTRYDYDPLGRTAV
jgi:YD repeat-containing protein